MNTQNITLLLSLLFVSIVTSYEPGVHYNLLLANTGENSIEEYRGDNFDLIRLVDNWNWFQIQDVAVKDSYIYVIPYSSYTVEVFNEETGEHVYTLYDWSAGDQTPFRFALLNDNQLAVMLQPGNSGESGFAVFDVDTGEQDYIQYTQVWYVSMAQRTDNTAKEIWASAPSYGTIDKLTSDGVFSSEILDYTSFPPGEIFTWLRFHNNSFWLVTLGAFSSTIWKIHPDTHVITEIVSVDMMEIASFLFDPDGNIIIVGVVVNSDYISKYSTGYVDGRIYKYDFITLTNFTEPDQDLCHLGWLSGSSWSSSGDGVWVGDYSRLWKFDFNGVFMEEMTQHHGFAGVNGVAADPQNETRAFVSFLNRLVPFDLVSFDFVEEDIVSSMYSDADGSEFSVNGISVSSEGHIYAASFQGSKVFSNDSSLISFFNGSEGENNGIAIAPNGDTWVIYGNTNVAKWNVTSSSWVHELSSPRDNFTDLVVTEDSLIVASDQSILRYSLDDLSAPEAQFQALSEWTQILDMEIGPDGLLYVLSLYGVSRLSVDDLERVDDAVVFNFDLYRGSSITFVKAYCECPESECTYGVCKKKNNTALIIGVVVGVGALIGIASLAGFLVWKKKYQKKDSEDIPLDLKSFEAHWEIKFKELEIGENIGSGAFGAVFKAVYRNSDCVVKQLKDSENATAMANFLKEAHTVIRVKPHKNVCFLFGVCTDPEYPTCIVMEYVNGGSLQGLLADEKIDLTVKNILKIFKDVVSGMSHLHYEGLLHCDLACRNLLVTLEKGNDFTVKLSDFGLARFSETGTYDASVNTVFPVRWSAPEVLRGSKLSKASDVWAFGIVMYEIVQGTVPYLPMTNQEVIDYVCVQKQILQPPTRMGNLPPEIYDCMKSCWAFAAGNRPTFDGIFQTLKDLETDLYEKEPVANTPSQETNNTSHDEPNTLDSTDHHYANRASAVTTTTTPGEGALNPYGNAVQSSAPFPASEVTTIEQEALNPYANAAQNSAQLSASEVTTTTPGEEALNPYGNAVQSSVPFYAAAS